MISTISPDVVRLYESFVETEARKINSDGCTAVADWQIWCCWEHDLGCHYGKDPRDAFKRFVAGDPAYWINAAPLSRRDVDKLFTACNLRKSRGFFGTARSLIRYIGVRIGAAWPF